MTMTADATASPSLPRWLRIALLIVALIETLSALSDLPAIFYDYGHTAPMLIFAQALTKAKLALAPLFAGAALWFMIKAKPRNAIVALAALALLRWIAELPSIALHGLELSASFSGLFMFAVWFVYPALGIAALWLALRNRRLVLAGLLVMLPTLAALLSVAAFAIGVMRYGF